VGKYPVKSIRVSTIGYGYIGKIHTIAYRALPLCYPDFPYDVVLKDIVSKQTFDQKPSLYDHVAREIEEIGETDLVDICTPNFVHLKEIQQLIRMGVKNIYCEKPLTGFYEDEKKLALVANDFNIHNQVALVYRFLPAIIRGKRIVEEGILGDLIHFNCSLYHAGYLDANRPFTWRLEKAKSGGGALIDLGIHVIDTLRYVLGDVASVRGYTKTVIPKRPCNGVMRDVDVDDFAHLELELQNHVCGAIEVSRVAAGATGDLNFEIYGTKGSMKISTAQPEYPSVCFWDQHQWGSGRQFVFADAEDDIHRLWPTDKFSLGWMTNLHMASIYGFLSIMQGQTFRYMEVPVFSDSEAAMKIIDSVYQNGASAEIR
jgi:predicted dehydrogenase